MVLGIYQKQKSLLGWTILNAMGPIVPWLLIAGGMLGERTGIWLLITAIVSIWLIYKFGNRLLNLPPARATEIADTELQSQRAGLPMPKVYEVECRRIAAQSMGPSPHDATIILTSEFQKIPPEEKGAAIAHELAHVGNRDCLLLPVFGTSIAVLEILAFAGGIERWFMGIILLLLVAVPWERELRADAVGARTCGAPLALANALRRMKPNPSLSKLAAYLALSLALFLPAIYPQNEGWLLISFIALWLAICLPTHPPTFYRVWRLERLAAQQGTPR